MQVEKGCHTEWVTWADSSWQHEGTSKATDDRMGTWGMQKATKNVIITSFKVCALSTNLDRWEDDQIVYQTWLLSAFVPSFYINVIYSLISNLYKGKMNIKYKNVKTAAWHKE